MNSGIDLMLLFGIAVILLSVAICIRITTGV